MCYMCHGNTRYDQRHRSGVSNMSEFLLLRWFGRLEKKNISDLIHCIFPGSVRSALQWLLGTPWWPQSNPDRHYFLRWISVSKQFSTPPVLFSGNLHSLFYILVLNDVFGTEVVVIKWSKVLPWGALTVNFWVAPSGEKFSTWFAPPPVPFVPSLVQC